MPSLPRRPRVALLVETSLGSGREILAGIGRFLREEGPWEIYHEPRHLTDACPKWLSRWDGDGIIARLQTPAMAAAVAATGLPAVDVLGVAPHPKIPVVRVDEGAIARLAAEHLVERGFRHLAFLGLRGEPWSLARETAFAQAAREAGASFDALQISRSPKGGWEAQQAQLAAWVAGLPRPVGIMACNDPPGRQLLEACRSAGIAVPEDAAVVGVDNDGPVCDVCDPPLSSVEVGHERLGHAGARLLAQLMQGKKAQPPAPIAPLALVTRQSSDIMAVADPVLAQALAFIRKNAFGPVDVDDVVRAAPASRSTLNRKFQAALRHGVADEIIRVRLQRAKVLLATTDHTLDAVARMCGYVHPEYFGVVFRRTEGLSPAKWRRRHRG